jgi:hypothetical protein
MVTVQEFYNESLGIDSVVAIIQKYLQSYNLTELPLNIKTNLRNQLVAKFKLSETVATCVVVSAWEYLTNFAKETLEDPVNIGPSYYDTRFLVATKDLIDELNISVSWPFTEFTIKENNTHFQQKCDDELFIEFPNRNALLNDESDNMNSFLPKLSDLCNPYGIYDLDDMSEYKSSPKFPEKLYPLVEGQSSNDTTELYDNEKHYYNALVEWVQFNMKNTIAGDVDVSTSNPNIDRLSQVYLEELAKLLYTKHWYHNKNIPIFNQLVEDDLTDLLDSTTNDSVTSDYEFRASNEEKSMINSGAREVTIKAGTHINALELLVSFLREASLIVGYGAYLQAIIQLARWGERKPTKIIIENYSLVFSLGDNKIKTYMGSINNYKIKPVDGCSVSAVNALYDDVALKCKQFMIDEGYPYKNVLAPVGLTTVKVLENTTDKGPKSIEVFLTYSIIEIIESYVSGSNNINIAGITYDGNKFTADDVVIDTSLTYQASKTSWANNDNNLESPFKSSRDLYELSLELDVPIPATFTHFDVLDACARQEDLDLFIENNKFSSKDDLNDKIRTSHIRNKKSAFMYSLGSKLLPIYFKVSLKLNELKEAGGYNFGDVLNIYKEVLSKNSLDIFEKEEKSKSENDNVNNMNVFGNSTTNMDASETTTEQAITPNNIAETVTARFTFIREKSADSKISKIVSGGKTIGYCAVDYVTVNSKKGPVKASRFTLLQNTPEYESASAGNKTLELSAIIYRIVFDLYSYEINDENKIFLYFSDLSCMKYYVRTIKECFDNKG